MSERDLSPTAQQSPRRLAYLAGNRWAALPVLMAGTFMIVLDFFIVNVALPRMQADLNASSSAIEWVIAGYGLTFATCLVTAGKLGDQIGRRRTFSIGLLLFTFASAACGVASNATILVVFRLLQGVAAALISPSVLSLIGVLYRGPDRVRAITVYGMVMGLAAVGAQLIGGVLVQADIAGLGWRTVFLVNVPVGLAALVLAPALVQESRAGGASRLDLAGAAILTAGLTAIVLPLVEGRQHGWPAWTWLCLAGAPFLLGLFALHERRLGRGGGTPLLDSAMFRERAFLAGNLVQLVFWCGQASFFFVLALYLQQGRGLDALQAGLIFTILAGAYLAASLRAPMLTVRHGRRLVAIGATTLASGHALLLAGVAGTGTTGPIVLLVPGLLLVGTGMGLCITPMVSTVLTSVDPQRAGAVSGTLSTMQQLGNALGVAVTGVIFFGAVQGGYPQAFEVSLAELSALLLAVAALSRLLPGARHESASG